jgi:hypothetical protein
MLPRRAPLPPSPTRPHARPACPPPRALPPGQHQGGPLWAGLHPLKGHRPQRPRQPRRAPPRQPPVRRGGHAARGERHRGPQGPGVAPAGVGAGAGAGPRVLHPACRWACLHPSGPSPAHPTPCPAPPTPQVTVHIKGQTECYECTHRGSQQRTFPVCTLRNTPDKPIHCIVWAKDMLFARLFGPPETSGAPRRGGARVGGAGHRGAWGRAALTDSDCLPPSRQTSTSSPARQRPSRTRAAGPRPTATTPSSGRRTSARPRRRRPRRRASFCAATARARPRTRGACLGASSRPTSSGSLAWRCARGGLGARRWRGERGVACVQRRSSSGRHSTPC